MFTCVVRSVLLCSLVTDVLFPACNVLHLQQWTRADVERKQIGYTCRTWANPSLPFCLSFSSDGARGIDFHSAKASVLLSFLWTVAEKKCCSHSSQAFAMACRMSSKSSVLKPNASWWMWFFWFISKLFHFRLVQTVLNNPVSKCCPCNCYAVVF